MPQLEDIGKAYRTYYTHNDFARKDDLLHRLYQYAKAAYIQRYHLSEEADSSITCYFAARTTRVLRSVRDDLDFPGLYFARGKGRFLDVGCGTGRLIQMAERYGWDAEGVDVDNAAVEVARGKGLSIQSGTLTDQNYSGSTFDLIIMMHVIEHLHDPIHTLREVWRLLKPGGILLVFTPNTDSIGHQTFRIHWLHLDPPRHILLFNPSTIEDVARRAGFKQMKVQSTLRDAPNRIISERIRDGMNPLAPFTIRDLLRARVAAVRDQMRLSVSPLLGDELLLEAIK